MADPFTLSGFLVSVGAEFAAGMAYKGFEKLLDHWRQAATDPKSGLPRSDDLDRASRESLRGAVQVLILELAGRLDPNRSWLTRRVEQGRWTTWLACPLFPRSRAPEQ